jgi:hypothetical protein
MRSDRVTSRAATVAHSFSALILVAPLISGVIFVAPGFSQDLQRSTTRAERDGSTTGTQIAGDLGAGRVVEQRLSRGERQTWAIRLRAGDYVDVEVNSNEIDVAVTIYDPSSAPLTRTAHRQSGPRRLSFLARRSGEHGIQIGSLESTETTGIYQIQVRECRPSTRGDIDRVDASKLFADAEGLRDKMTLRLAHQAVQKYQVALRLWMRAGDLSWQSFALTRLADMYAGLGKPHQARQHYQRSMD